MSDELREVREALQRANRMLQAAAQQAAETPANRLMLPPGMPERVCKGEITLVVSREPLACSGSLLLTDQDMAYGTVQLDEPRPMSIPEFRLSVKKHGMTDEMRKERWPKQRRLYCNVVKQAQAWPSPRLLAVSKELPPPRYEEDVTKDSGFVQSISGEGVSILSLAHSATGVALQQLPAVAARLEKLLEVRGQARIDLAHLEPLLEMVHAESAGVLKADDEDPLPRMESTTPPFELGAVLAGSVESLAGMLPARCRQAAHAEQLLKSVRTMLSLEKAVGPDPTPWVFFVDVAEDVIKGLPVEMLQPLHSRAQELLDGPLSRAPTLGALTEQMAQDAQRLLKEAGAKCGVEFTVEEAVRRPDLPSLEDAQSAPDELPPDEVEDRLATLYNQIAKRSEARCSEVELLAAGVEPINKGAPRLVGEDRPGRGVLHLHARGNRLHVDMRMEVGDETVSYALACQHAAADMPPLDLEGLRGLAKAFTVTGSSHIKALLAPERVFCVCKGAQPNPWLDVEEESFAPGETGAADDEVGAMLAVARPAVTCGLITKSSHEYFLERDKQLFGRLLVEKQGEEDPYWTATLTDDLLPNVLKAEADVPPQGWSGLPVGVKKLVPREMQYWRESDVAKRTQRRDELMASGFVTGEQLMFVGGAIGKVVTKYYMEELIEDATDEDVAETVSKIKWSTKYINDLPDSAFLHIESGGKKDSEGKTVPRALRHFPVRDHNGKLDAPHLRNALSRIPQSKLPQSVKDKTAAKARRLLASVQKMEMPELPSDLPKTLLQDTQIQLLKYETKPPVDDEDEEERYVLGVVLVPNEVDSQGDIYSEEEVRKAAHFFMEFSPVLGLMHERTLPEAKIKILESYLAPVDFDMEGQHVTEGTWLLAARVLDDALWAAIKAGRLTGWSIEGTALAMELN